MRIIVSTIVILAAFGSAAAAEDLGDLDQGKSKQEVTLKVGCGQAAKANCALVLRAINEQTLPNGIRLEGINGEGSTQSALTGVCRHPEIVPLAIGQRDAFQGVAALNECQGRFNPIGAPLYPYYGFFIVRADSEYSSVSDMVRGTPQDKSVDVAVGKSGSGGRVTMEYIVAAMPTWKRAISMKDFDPKTVVERLRDGGINAYFIMDAFGSPAVAEILSQVDTKTNRPLFKFLDVSPDDSFYSLTDWKGGKLYQSACLKPGSLYGCSTSTISVDAIAIADEKWRNKQPDQANVFSTAVYDADASIIAQTKTPKDWKAVGK